MRGVVEQRVGEAEPLLQSQDEQLPLSGQLPVVQAAHRGGEGGGEAVHLRLQNGGQMGGRQLPIGMVRAAADLF